MSFLSARWLSLSFFVFLSLGLLTPLRSETAGYPKDDPDLTVVVPAGWHALYTTTTPSWLSVLANDDSGYLTIKELPEDTEVGDVSAVKAALDKFARAGLSKVAKDIKFTEPKEVMVSGHKAYATKCTFLYHDQPLSEEDTIFTPDGETYYLLIDGKGNAAAIIATIKEVE